jgi:hypothetical protein
MHITGLQILSPVAIPLYATASKQLNPIVEEIILAPDGKIQKIRLM